MSILPGLRRELETDFYTRIGFLPNHDFYSDNRLFKVFTNEANKYFALTGQKELELQTLIHGDTIITEGNKRTIYNIATLSLVSLAMCA